MSLRTIVATLGGDLYDRGLRANIPAPGHSRADRSVSLVISGGRIIVHTFNGTDWCEVLDDLRRQGLIDAANAPCSLSRAAAASRTDKPVGRERLAVACAIWEGGRGVHDTLSERHLRTRHVRRPLPGATVLRHHPQAPVAVYGPGAHTRPALLGAIHDAEGAFVALELTYLDPNGQRAVGLRLSRKTVGHVPAGSAIRVDAAAPQMLVAEGLATCLSATERFQLPGWALMSTRNLRGWRAPEGVRSVLIAADRGADGEASAQVLAARLRRAGLRSRIELPPRGAGDWNDAARPLG